MKETICFEIFYIGDFIKNNGPAQIDKNLKRCLENEKIFFCQINRKFNKKELNVFLKAKTIHVSGVSFKGFLYSFLGNVLGKNITCTTHGLLKIEKKYRKMPKHRIYFEKIIFSKSNIIIAVSEGFSLKVKDVYPKFSTKVIYINNGVDCKEII